MSRIKRSFDITGSVGNISIYKIRGSDEPIARKKGGPTKKMVKNRESFDITRRNNMEFGGRARMTKQVMSVLRIMKYQGDYNLAGPLNSLFIPIQALDTVSEFGERNIELTKNPGLLEGFNINRRTPFSTIITNTPAYTLSKDPLSATVTVPELIQGVNFFPAENFSWYRLVAVLGVIEDLFFERNKYVNRAGYNAPGHWGITMSDWLQITPKNQAVQLTCDLGEYGRNLLKEIGTNNHSCLLAIGIAYGTMIHGEIEMVKYVGGGKILAMR